jgi:hypothetical protein
VEYSFQVTAWQITGYLCFIGHLSSSRNEMLQGMMVLTRGTWTKASISLFSRVGKVRAKRAKVLVTQLGWVKYERNERSCWSQNRGGKVRAKVRAKLAKVNQTVGTMPVILLQKARVLVT